MLTPEVQAYVRQQLDAGVAPDAIKQALAAQGWTEQDVQDAFATEVPPISQAAVPEPDAQALVQSPIQTSVFASHTGVMVVAAAAVLLVGAGGTFAAYRAFSSRQQAISQTSSTTPPIATQGSNPASPPPTTNTACASYQCLISAALQCTPIAATVSYSGVEVFPGILTSGSMKYEIKKSSGVNSCTLVFTPLSTTLSMTDAARKQATAQGMTDAQVTEQLKVMNDSVKSASGTVTQTTCPGTASAIAAYLSDTENGIFKANSNGKTTTYTTTSGQTLVCTITVPSSSSVMGKAGLTSEGLFVGVASSFGGLESKANTITTGQANITFTDTATKQSKTVTLTLNNPVTIFGYNVVLVDTKKATGSFFEKQSSDPAWEADISY